MIKLLCFIFSGGVLLFSIFFRPAQQPAAIPADVTGHLANANLVSAIDEGSSQDRLTHPPAVQTVVGGGYELTIAAKDDWRSPTAIGKLSKNGTPLWEKALPHHYGPRFFLVSPSGQAVLFDEYINVASPYAIALIDPTGETVAQYSFDDIKQALPTLAPADFTRQATSGWWISSRPTLDATGSLASVETGGTTLELDLATGELRRSNPQ
ncbi:MAG: hypothetical protein WBA76_01640 [Phormidesmis sp.]